MRSSLAYIKYIEGKILKKETLSILSNKKALDKTFQKN